MMTGPSLFKVGCGKKIRLNLTGLVVLAASTTFGLGRTSQVSAQDIPAQSVVDTWQATLHSGKDMRMVVKIESANGGGLDGLFYSIDQSGDGLPLAETKLQDATLTFSLKAIGATYMGKLSPDGKSINGKLTIVGSNPLPFNLARSTPETAWTIPPPTPKLPPMAKDASPSFEVATIKPSKPDEQGHGITVQGRRLATFNTTLSDLLTFSYGLNPKQIVAAPAWVETDKFDISAEPKGEGAPSSEQWKVMIKKLISDRCKLGFHRDEKELSVYTLSVGKSGARLTKSAGDPNGLPGLGFQGRLGSLSVRNATIGDFTTMMLQGEVLDRPVLDQTGIKGRYDFTLDWTPDDSQFRSMGATIPPPTDSADAPPPLFTAIQEQIGLRLAATRALAPVIVIDHIEKPSEN